MYLHRFESRQLIAHLPIALWVDYLTWESEFFLLQPILVTILIVY